MTRSAFLAAAALLSVASASPLSPRWGMGADNALGSLAEKAGKLYFGTEVSSYYFANTTYSSIFREQFNQITPENEMKWEVIEPERGVFNWTGSDLILGQVEKSKSNFRGHNFCWDQQTPAYVTNITDADELKTVLKEHIDAVMGRYGEHFYAFDVINEPLNENGTIKPSVWYNVLGEDYLAIALNFAHAAAPNVKLYINDYNIETVNNKSTALLSIAKGLLSQGVPLSGIGFESHFIGGSAPTDLAEAMKMFTDIGLDVAITELDVRVPVANDGTANSTWLAIQAQDYANVTRVCIENHKCPGVTVWGFTDYFSWIPGVFAGFGAADLYGLQDQPKPALSAVRAVLS